MNFGGDNDTWRKEWLSEAQKKAENAEARYAEKKAEAEARMTHLNEQAREIVDKWWQPYTEEQDRLAQETGVEPAVREPADFIKTVEGIRNRIPSEFAGELGKIAATVDFFKPRLDRPVEFDNLESNGNERVARMEMGSKDPNSATQEAQKRGLNYLLKIQQDFYARPYEFRGSWAGHRMDIDREVWDSQRKFVPISQETAQLLDHARGLAEETSLYTKGPGKGWHNRHGILKSSFDVFPIQAPATPAQGNPAA